MASPDPIHDPRGYQEMLVSLVGSDDPAGVQRATPTAVRSLLAESGALASTRPGAGEWSVIECLAHMVDAEIVASGRYRWILAQDQPDLPGYDQDLWADRLHDPVEDADQLFALFEPLRDANVALWRRSSEEQRDRIGLHRERGPESYRLTFTLMAGHDRFHLEQARRALASVSAGAPREIR